MIAFVHPDTASQALTTVVRGRLGQTPSGPLFLTVADPMSPHRFVVTGLGIALSLGVPEAAALADACLTGIAAIEAAK